jgi:hypothetical protein
VSENEYSVNRFGWQRGEWDEEPDLLRWDCCGYPCALVRTPIGAWCGYVGLQHDHPDHGGGQGDTETDLSAHGGVTWAGAPTSGIKAACALREHEVGMPSMYWIGFDCAHGGMDMFPMEPDFLRDSRPPDCYYKTIAWAKAETERLAHQLKGRESGNLRLVT